jgi:hypothetical protein
MTPERWRRAKELFHEALERAPAERDRMLAEACAGDAELRAEVEALIAAHERTGSFLDAPAYEVAAGMIADAPVSPRETLPPTKAATVLRAGAGTNDAAPGATTRGDGSVAEAARAPRSSHPFFRVVLVLAALFVCYYAFAFTVLYRYGGVVKYTGWTFGQRGAGSPVEVVETDPESEAGRVLRPGDLILAMDGDERVAVTSPWLRLRAKPAGEPYTLRVARADGVHEFTLTTHLRRLGPPPLVFVAGVVVSLVYFAFALVVGLLKPAERAAQVASLAAFGVALYVLNPLLQYPDSHGFLRGAAEYAYYAAYFLHPLDAALAYHFFYRFPPGVRTGRFWSVVCALLYTLAAALAVLLRWREYATVQEVDVAMRMFSEHHVLFRELFRLEDYFLGLVFVAIFAVVVRNHRVVSGSDQLRRLRIVTFGALAYALPPIFIIAIQQFYAHFGGMPDSTTLAAFEAIGMLARLTELALPLIIAYAIVRHQVFDINVVVRRGVRYLLAKNALRVLLALPVAALVLSVVADPDRTVSEILFRNSVYFYLLAIAAAALSLKYRPRVLAWLDRKFFREAYDRERVLLLLLERIKDCDTMAEMSRLVSRQVDAALHPRGIHLFYREDERRDLALSYSTSGAAQTLRIAEDSTLLRAAERAGAALDYPLRETQELTPDERGWLERLGVRLVVPLAGTDGRLAGLFLLGEKMSEEEYTPSDRTLLEAVAGQVAVVHENVRLKERVRREQRVRADVLRHFGEQDIKLLRECPVCGRCYDPGEETCADDGAELSVTLPVERTVDGKYRLERLLGRGGMGAVYEATDLRLGRGVAVKIMTGDLFGDPSAQRRFRREARTSARLAHPNVVSVHDYGQLAAGGAYLVMELVRGRTLRDELRREGRLDAGLCADLFEQVLEGVKAAHAAGIVHRDLKPENVLIVAGAGEKRAPVVKLLDFGIAKTTVLDAADTVSRTAPGTLLGTFGYMSPEQLQGQDADERTDLFAVGVMAAEAVTGERPFRGRTIVGLLHDVQRGAFRLAGDAPAARRLERALQKALAHDPAARYRNADEMQRELIPALRAYESTVNSRQ